MACPSAELKEMYLMSCCFPPFFWVSPYRSLTEVNVYVAFWTARSTVLLLISLSVTGPTLDTVASWV